MLFQGVEYEPKQAEKPEDALRCLHLRRREIFVCDRKGRELQRGLVFWHGEGFWSVDNWGRFRATDPVAFMMRGTECHGLVMEWEKVR